MADVSVEVQELAVALGRRLDTDGLHVTQHCPLCEAVLGLWVDRDITAARLRRQLFAHYDEHRCVDPRADRFTVFERAERAFVTAADRIAKIDDHELRARAELEADRMAAIVNDLSGKIRM